MDLLVTARPGRGCTVVQVSGDLDRLASPQLRDSVERLIDAGSRQVVIDLAEVGFMDSSALGALVLLFNSLREVGGRLCLAAPQPFVHRVLRITSVDRTIRVYNNVEAAEADMPSTDDDALNQ